ncbi:MAG: hypothetical protein JW984_16310 [Deltaproteobacteria bacterium]|uniref:Uncharacterized protein n=1 Tax=Candidatus Zymogenus saltonus TaxID=2844893 RepID=A0A9D8PSG1_9DELT|nr:hypothetical protein [Candidatus Zymogenus saltonus]
MKRISLILVGVMILAMSGCLFLFHDTNKSLLIFFNKDGSIDYVIHEDGTVTKFYPDGSKRHYDAGQYGPSADGGWDYKYGAPGEKQGYEGRTIWVDHGDGRVTYYTAKGEKLYTRDSQGNKVWYDRDGRESFREDADGTITHLIWEKDRVEGVEEIKNKMPPPAAYAPGGEDNKSGSGGTDVGMGYEDDLFNKPLPPYDEKGEPGSIGTPDPAGGDKKPKPYPLYTVKKPDGSSITVFSDGSEVAYYPDGSIRFKIGPGYQPNITYYKDGKVWYVEDHEGNVIYHSGGTIPDDMKKGNREEVDRMVQSLDKSAPASKKLEGNTGPEYGYEGEKGNVKEEKVNMAQSPETETIGTPTPGTGDNKETDSFDTGTPTPNTGGDKETGSFDVATPTPGTGDKKETGSFNVGTPTPKSLKDEFERDSDGNVTYFYTDGKKAYTVHPDGSVTYYDENENRWYTKHKDGTVTYYKKEDKKEGNSTEELSNFLEETDTGNDFIEGGGNTGPGGGMDPSGGHGSYE